MLMIMLRMVMQSTRKFVIFITFGALKHSLVLRISQVEIIFSLSNVFL